MKTQIRKLNAITVLFMILLLNATYPLLAQNAGLPVSDLFGRKYKVGEIYRYKLTMEELHDGKFDTQTLLFAS